MTTQITINTEKTYLTVINGENILYNKVDMQTSGYIELDTTLSTTIIFEPQIYRYFSSAPKLVYNRNGTYMITKNFTKRIE